jgi:hypothetical protein
VVQEQSYANYLDAPQTPGTWMYRNQSNGGMALYSGTSGTALFMLECDRIAAHVSLFRATNGSAPQVAATITSETVTRNLQLTPAGPGHIVNLSPRDPLLDAMAITKGRIAIGVEGERTLYLPAWVEISRVIEDCR